MNLLRLLMLQGLEGTVISINLLPKSHMGGCQNYGPFLGTLNIRCRIIIGIQKWTIILTTTHICFKTSHFRFGRLCRRIAPNLGVLQVVAPFWVRVMIQPPEVYGSVAPFKPPKLPSFTFQPRNPEFSVPEAPP